MRGAPDSREPGSGDRRQQRRQQTLTEILDHAVEIMGVRGVAGLTIAALAKQMGIQPPSLYKYYASLEAVYDALFRRGQQENLDALRAGMSGAGPGLPAVAAGMAAAARWAFENPVVAQLLFWRPIPGYEPAPDAFAPALAIVDLLRTELRNAVVAGDLHPDGASDRGMDLLSSLHFGVISQHLANDPEGDRDDGRFSSLHPRVLDLFVLAYPPIASTRRT